MDRKIFLKQTVDLGVRPCSVGDEWYCGKSAPEITDAGMRLGYPCLMGRQFSGTVDPVLLHRVHYKDKAAYNFICPVRENDTSNLWFRDYCNWLGTKIPYTSCSTELIFREPRPEKREVVSAPESKWGSYYTDFIQDRKGSLAENNEAFLRQLFDELELLGSRPKAQYAITPDFCDLGKGQAMPCFIGGPDGILVGEVCNPAECQYLNWIARPYFGQLGLSEKSVFGETKAPASLSTPVQVVSALQQEKIPASGKRRRAVEKEERQASSLPSKRLASTFP